MGNGAIGGSAGPCEGCRHYGGRIRYARPVVICDNPYNAGTFAGNATTGCFRREPGDPRVGKRVIVCGGRDYEDRARAYAALDAAHAKGAIAVVVEGGAPGADRLARQWAQERGVLRDEFPADWDRLRGAAGPIRNQAMADAGADGCIALPGGRGTRDMATRAELAGIAVWRPYG